MERKPGGDSEQAPASHSFSSLFRLSNEEWPGQRTLRLSYDDGAGAVTLYLIWRLESPSRYSLSAKDRLGRSWWSLAVDGDQALALEVRERRYCRYFDAVQIASLPLGPLEFSVLPLLLVGRVPARAHGAIWKEPRDEEAFGFADVGGREWTVSVATSESGAAAEPRAISWSASRAGVPVVWYEAQGDLHFLSSRGAEPSPEFPQGASGIQLRWKLGALQELRGEVLELSVPEGYERGSC